MQRSSEAWLRELAASGFSFPRVRARRLRIHPGVRSLVAETRLDPSMFILPLFVEDGLKSPKPLRGLPGHYKYPPESRELVELVSRALDLGVRNFLIFGTRV